MRCGRQSALETRERFVGVRRFRPYGPHRDGRYMAHSRRWLVACQAAESAPKETLPARPVNDRLQGR